MSSVVEPLRVLILCTHNSARSQMGEALLRSLGGERFTVESAGTVATRVHPLAAAVMAERGLDLSSHRSKTIDELDGRRFDLVITVCDSARDACPYFPGATERIHWSLPDPSAAEGEEEARKGAFRRVADELTVRLRQLVDERRASGA